MKTLFIPLLILISFSVFAQKTYKVEYETVIENYDPLISYESDSIDKLTVIFNSEFGLYESSGLYQNVKTYHDKTRNTYYNILLGQIKGGEEVSKGFNTKYFQKRRTLLTSDSTKEILGLECRFFEDRGENYWIADDLGKNDNIFWLRVPGIPLEWTYKTLGKSKMILRAISIEEVEPADVNLPDVKSVIVQKYEPFPEWIYTEGSVYEKRILSTKKEYLGRIIKGLEFKTESGRIIGDEEMRGKIVVINFWGQTGGKFSVEEYSKRGRLKKFKEALQENGDDILFLTMPFLKKKKLNKVMEKYPSGFIRCRASKKLKANFGAFYSYPNVVLDKTGKIIYYDMMQEPMTYRNMYNKIIEKANSN